MASAAVAGFAVPSPAAGNCSLVTKGEAAAATGQKEQTLIDGNETPGWGCTYPAPQGATGVRINVETFETASAARSHFDFRANIDKKTGVDAVQMTAGLGDGAYVTIGREMDDIMILKGTRILEIWLLGKLRLVDPKGALIKLGTTALHRL